MPQDETTSLQPFTYARRENGQIVARRKGLLQRRPSAEALPPDHPGSTDWTLNLMFGSVEDGVRMLESVINGQGESAREQWVELCVLYRHWQWLFEREDLPLPPTMNQVCYSLGIDTAQLLTEIQRG